MTAPDARTAIYELLDWLPSAGYYTDRIFDILCPPGEMRVVDRRGDTPLLRGLEHVDLLAEIVRVWDAGGEWIRGEFEVLMDEARRLSPVGDPERPLCRCCYSRRTDGRPTCQPCYDECTNEGCVIGPVGDPEPQP